MCLEWKDRQIHNIGTLNVFRMEGQTEYII